MHLKSIMLYLKRNLYFILSMTTLILTFSAAVVLLAVFDLGKPVAQTSVGFVYLGSTDPSEYGDVLAPRIAQWQDTADYALSYQEYEWVIDLNYFVFDVDNTVQNVDTDQNNKAYFTITEDAKNELHQDLISDLSQALIDGFDYDALLDDLESDMSLLKNRKTYDLKDYIDISLYDTAIDTIQMDNLPLSVVTNIHNAIDDITIPAHARFTLSDALMSYDLTNEELSVIASAMQHLFVVTPVQGFIFEPYTTLPTWVLPGANVRILLMSGYDFSFFNPLQETMTVSVDRIDQDSLLFTLKGYPFLTQYQRVVENGSVIYFQEIRNENLSLNETTPGITVIDTITETTYELIITPGVNGQVILYNRLTTPLHQAASTITLFSEQQYPVTQIVEEHVIPKG